MILFYFHAQAVLKWAHFLRTFAFDHKGGAGRALFRINLYGFGLLVLAGIIVNVVARPLLPGREPVWMALAGITMIAVDLILRGRSRGKGNRWFSGEFGATIAFPAWILGICLIGYGAAKQMGLGV